MTEENEDRLQYLLKNSLTFTELKLLLQLKSENADNWNRRSCSNCKNELSKGYICNDLVGSDLLLSEFLLLDDVTVTFLQCKICNKFDALWLDDCWCSVEEVLQDRSICSTKFSPVESPVDHLRIFLLSQICHNQQDLDLSSGESPFFPPNPSDCSTLIWKDKHAVGFYAIKQKGTAYPGYPTSCFALDVIDTIYIRRFWRRLGLASLALSEVISKYLDADIGFSDPVSNSLLGVLCRFLSICPNLRDRLWVCSFTGEPGYRWNIYLRMKSKILKAKRLNEEKKKIGCCQHSA